MVEIEDFNDDTIELYKRLYDYNDYTEVLKKFESLETEATDYFNMYLDSKFYQVENKQQKILYKLFIEWKMLSDTTYDREDETKQKYSNLHNLLKAIKENLTRKEDKGETVAGSEFEILIC